MGCGQSKNQIGISPGGNDTTPIANGGTPSKKPMKRTSSKKINVKSSEDLSRQHTSDLEDEVEIPPPQDSRKKKNKRLVKKDSWVAGSQESLGGSDGTDSRQGSATSKGSHHSADSGFADNEYNHVITEFSDPDAVQAIEGDFETPRDLDLGVVGKQCPQRYSAKDKERMEEQRVIATLREEGLIARPMSRAVGGLAFEVTAEPNGFNGNPLGGGARPSLPPLKLAKLEKRKKRRRKLTEEDIKRKLQEAEERRKEAEQQRVEKIIAVTQKSNVQTALDSFANMQKTKEVESVTKVDQAAENREKRMKELQEKLRKKREHAEKVRLRKQIAPMNTDEDLPPLVPNRFTEDTPIGVKAN